MSEMMQAAPGAAMPAAKGDAEADLRRRMMMAQALMANSGPTPSAGGAAAGADGGWMNGLAAILGGVGQGMRMQQTMPRAEMMPPPGGGMMKGPV